MNFDRLRSLLFEQAIRGELVEQQAIDFAVPVPVVDGVLPKESYPFEIPDHWKWYPLGKIVEYGKCTQIDSGEISETIWVLDLEDIEKGTGRLLNKKRGTLTTSNKAKFCKGDVLYGKLRPYLNKVLIADEDGVCTTEIVPISVVTAKLPLLAEYLQSYLMSPFFLDYANKISYGVKMPRLGTKDAKAALIPVPPVEEQARIVAKLEEAFSEIDRAEKAYEELQTLAGVLRGQILQEAIQGKLVPQLAEEGVVEQIGAALEEVPFEIPESWKWVQLKSIGQIIGGGTPKTSVADYWNGDISWITPADLGKNTSKWILKGAKSITQKGLDESSAKLMPEGSIIYSSRAPIGHIAIAAHELCTNQGCKSFVPDAQFITTEWAYYMLIARTRDIQSRASGTTFKEISGKGVGETWVSLPPIAEQQRIVAKVEELLKQVDTLSA